MPVSAYMEGQHSFSSHKTHRGKAKLYRATRAFNRKNCQKIRGSEWELGLPLGQAMDHLASMISGLVVSETLTRDVTPLGQAISTARMRLAQPNVWLALG